MAHEIYEHDSVFSIEGTEWHGLAQHVEKIDCETVKPLMVPLIEGTPTVQTPDGTIIRVDGYKTILADIRERGGDVKFVPLHTPKDSYRMIPNSDIWNMVLESIKGLDCKVTTAGTLDNLKKFFVSVDLGGGDLKTRNGDKFLAFLNFLTSHDGTITVEARDSMIRVVCMNTFRASRYYTGALNVSIPHTKNAGVRIQNMGEYLNSVLDGRKRILETMDELTEMPCDSGEASHVVSGFLTHEDADEMSTQAFNRTGEIVQLFARGKGNNGKTRYDLFNGLTEFFTSGNGAGGKKASAAKRMSVAQFGLAAEYKEGFLDLLTDTGRYAETKARGEKLYRDKAMAMN